MLKSNKIFGSTLIIAGTTVGAGMLALPMISVQEGLVYAILTLVGIWGLMLYSALVLLGINLQFAHGASFSTMALTILGRPGQILMNGCMMALFYCLAAAYISGGSIFMSTGLEHYAGIRVPAWISSCCFTLILGGLVTWHTYAVDIVNRFLLSVKMLAFFIVIFFLWPHVDYHLLLPEPYSAGNLGNTHFIWFTIPIFFTAFGFHGSIPSIVKYVGHNPRALRRIFIMGSLIPLLLYVLWEIVILGILPVSRALPAEASITHFMTTLTHLIQRPAITASIHFFSNVAMTTSFLGVTLGLFDFFLDIHTRSQTPYSPYYPTIRRTIASALTFTPPLVFAIFYPHGFMMALGYAAIPLTVLAVLLPSLMAWKTGGGSLSLCVLFLFGTVVLLLQIFVSLGQLPGT